MKFLSILFCFALFVVSCNNSKSSKSDVNPVGVHEVIAKEAINTSSYTYVRVSEFGKETWLAIPKTPITIGGTYFYQGGMVMDKLESKELKRTFESVVFLEGLSTDKNNLSTNGGSAMGGGQNSEEKHTNVNASNQEKLSLNIKKAAGAITIAELFAKREQYAGKTVKITGQVTKFSADIMKKNWLHLQDGTDNAGKFDLTITTLGTMTVGETITIEGKIAIDKDFGYGYKYEVLMEDAALAK